MTPVAPRNVNNGSYVSRINHECCFAVQSSTGVVLCSTGVVFCSTEQYWSSTLVQSSTGVVRCSTVYWSSTL